MRTIRSGSAGEQKTRSKQLVFAIGLSLAFGSLQSVAARAADTCWYANDDLCQEPGGKDRTRDFNCEPGTDTSDCNPQPEPVADPNYAGPRDDSCPYAYDDKCQEPGGKDRNIFQCAQGTDTSDCNPQLVQQPPQPQPQPVVDPNQPGPRDDSCWYAYDDKCQEPGGADITRDFQCAQGTDTSDCNPQPEPVSDPNFAGPRDDSCPYAYDDQCQEPGGRDRNIFQCAQGTDTSDCHPELVQQPPQPQPDPPPQPQPPPNRQPQPQPLDPELIGVAPGTDTCRYANDGQCHEPGGAAYTEQMDCEPGTDSTDCGRPLIQKPPPDLSEELRPGFYACRDWNGSYFANMRAILIRPDGTYEYRHNNEPETSYEGTFTYDPATRRFTWTSGYLLDDKGEYEPPLQDRPYPRVWLFNGVLCEPSEGLIWWQPQL